MGCRAIRRVLMAAAARQPWLPSAWAPIGRHMFDWLPQPSYQVRGGSYMWWYRMIQSKKKCKLEILRT
ncbi:unnamed protein product, partial [Brenthis ino]